VIEYSKPIIISVMSREKPFAKMFLDTPPNLFNGSTDEPRHSPEVSQTHSQL
jgi:hypothetical protein